MNYDHVPPSDVDDDEEMEATVVVPPPRGLDCKYRMFYVCLGAFLTVKLMVLCWIIAQNVAPQEVMQLFNWRRE